MLGYHRVGAYSVTGREELLEAGPTDVSSTPIIDLESIISAGFRLRDVVCRTPVLTSTALDVSARARVLLKCESFQRTGSFKFRGAYNSIALLPAIERARGVVAYSSGNHGQAVALAARVFSMRAVVLMPLDAPASKIAAVKGYGAQVISYDRYRQDRRVLAAELAEREGMTVIPPYDHRDVMAGQGTVGLELLEQEGPFDAVVVPVGGGGLLAGVATALIEGSGPLRVFGVEPITGDDHAQSLQSGKRVRVPVPHTIADGLAVDRPGALTFQVTRHLIDEILTVTDDQIICAMRFLFDRMKLVVEPSGAASVAAILSGQIAMPGARIAAVISGGNIDSMRFASLLSASPRGQIVSDIVDSSKDERLD